MYTKVIRGAIRIEGAVLIRTASLFTIASVYKAETYTPLADSVFRKDYCEITP